MGAGKDIIAVRQSRFVLETDGSPSNFSRRRVLEPRSNQDHAIGRVVAAGAAAEKMQDLGKGYRRWELQDEPPLSRKRRTHVMPDSQSMHGPYLAAGTLVRYDGIEDGGPEYGVVVHCWFDEELGGYDCYVAFFGNRHPVGKPAGKPYVLRYASTSLTVMTQVCRQN